MTITLIKHLDDWFSKYDKGDISRLEILELAYKHIISCPEDTSPLLSFFHNHRDPSIKFLEVLMNNYLREKDNRARDD